METSDHDWDTLKEDCMTTGIRNAHVLAVAPNGNTAIAGSTQGIHVSILVLGFTMKRRRTLTFLLLHLT